MTPAQYVEYGLMAVAILGFIGTALSLGPKVSTWLAARTDELAERTGIHALSRIDDYIGNGVVRVFRTAVAEAKNLNSDGEFSNADKAAWKARVLAETKEAFGLVALMGLFNTGSEAVVNHELGGRIETGVLRAKALGRAAKKN